MNQSENIDAVAKAFVAAQAEFGHAPKEANNGHFNSKYADLATIIATVRPVLATHGLAVVQRSLPCDNGVRLQTLLLHESGQYLADEGMYAPLSKQDAQAVGSATTYLRRYGLAALLGVAQDDDDGNAASEPRAIGSKPVATGSVYTFTFGKHKDKPITDVPDDYLTWLLSQPAKDGYEKQHAESHAIYTAELERRNTNAA